MVSNFLTQCEFSKSTPASASHSDNEPTDLDQLLLEVRSASFRGRCIGAGERELGPLGKIPRNNALQRTEEGDDGPRLDVG